MSRFLRGVPRWLPLILAVSQLSCSRASDTAGSVADGLPALTAHAWHCGEIYVVSKLDPSPQGEVLTLFLPGQTVRLPHVRAASGARYSDGGVTFWNQGQEATLERGGTSVVCAEDRRASVVEDAKLRGVHFRGTGNEPPWILELGPEEITVYTGYDATHNAFEMVEPRTDAETGASVWETVDAAGRRLTLTIGVTPDGGRCADTMSGQTYESTVEIVLDGTVLRGCGQPLH